METLTYTGELTVTTCWCGIRHAVPKEMYDSALRSHNNGERYESIYCPVGHQWRFSGTTRSQQLEAELVRERNRTAAERAKHDQTKAELRATERRRAAAKGQLTKTKNRIAAGVCPCCNRTFQNLARHMGNQHPEFAVEQVTK
jgi:hypothetical protein